MIEVVTKILKVFENNNLFNEGVELIGSWCFHLYQKHLGAESFPLRTQDIDFLIPIPYQGKEHTDFINQLEGLGFISAIPLRFVDLLLDDPITVVEDGIKIRIPNPANFCLHKLIIASRRKKIDKSLKDLQQAICTSVIVNNQDIQKPFESLPKKWRQAIVRMLEKAKVQLPLLGEAIDNLDFTLQNVKK